MGKVRARAVKPKIQKGDFSKKKVKVGRKVKRANVTEIKVKSRRIVVPLQDQGSFADNDSTRETINRVIKHLHHHSESTRLNALNRVKDMLGGDIKEESFVTLVLPEVIELLFNEEKEPRTLVTEVVSLMLSKFHANSFLPVVSVMVTYICSGLTNIHKGIRKDSLVLLKTIAQKCPTLLAPYMEKLLRHTLALLTDSFHSATAPLVQQRDVAVTAGAQATVSSGASKVVTPTMFALILEVLAALLEQGSPKSIANSQTSGADSTGAVLIAFNPRFASNAALLLTALRPPAQGQAHSSSTSATAISAALAEEITVHITTVWKNLVMNSSALSMDVLASLQACTKILLCLAQAQRVLGESIPSFGPTVHTFFQHFPHSCTEAQLAVPGSEKERQGRLRIAQLDTALCELAFIHIAGRSGATEPSTAEINLRTTATAYLLQTLRAHVNSVATANQQREAPGDAERHAATKIFNSFLLLLSRNTLGELQELLELLRALFASLQEIERPSARRALNYLTAPATDCLCGIIDRLHVELSADYSETLYVLLVDSLEAALSLALSATWDQTALLAKLADAQLKVYKGRAGATDSPAMVEALVRLSVVYESLWTSPDAVEGEDRAATKTRFRNGYPTCTEHTRRQLLDAFLFAPFEDTFAAAAQVLEFLCTSSGVSLEEQAYFLRLLFDRRQELGLHDFADLLFSSLQRSVDCAVTEGRAASWAARWYAHEVADLLLWMASSEAPGKVVLFVAGKVQKLLNGVHSEQQEEPEGTTAQRKEWVQCAVLALSARLLVPWVAALEAQEVPEPERSALEHLVRWVAQVATQALSTPDEAKDDSAASKWQALAATLSLRLDRLPAESEASASHPFLLYAASLQAISDEAHLQRVGSAGREAALRNLQVVLQSAAVDERLLVEGKTDLSRAARAVAGNEEGLLKSLASDLLSLF